MLSQDLLKYMLAPQTLKQEDLKRLQNLVLDFPYFQPAHLLLSYAARMWDATVFQQSIHRTALVATDRNHLYQLMQKAEKANQSVEADVEGFNSDLRKKLVVKENLIGQELELINSGASWEDETKPVTARENDKAEQVPVTTETLQEEILKQRTAPIIDKEIIHKETGAQIEKQDLSANSGSFAEWLTLLKQNQGFSAFKAKPGTKTIEESSGRRPSDAEPGENQNENKKQKQRAIIDKIIENSPGVIRPKEEAKFFTPEKKAKESLLENEHLVTETLARIYAMQGNTAKAIRSYEILSLKYPQKSAYFASLIQNLKNNT